MVLFGKCLCVQNAWIMTSNLEVSLVPFTQKHVSITFNWISETELRNLFLIRGEIDWEIHKNYFNNILSDSTQYIFAILFLNRHVGNCGLKNISLKNKEGEMWIYIGDSSMRGKSIGKHATELLLHEGFNVLKLKMIYVHVADFNTAARRLYEKLGFNEVTMIDDSNEWSDRGCKIIRMELMKQK